MSDEHGDESANLHHESGEFRLSLLEAFDRILASVPIGDPVREELFALRPEIIRHEETIAEAGQMIEKLEEVIKKVTSPANRIGTFLGSPSRDTAHIVVGGSDYYCNIDPRIPLAKLKKRDARFGQ